MKMLEQLTGAVLKLTMKGKIKTKNCHGFLIPRNQPVLQNVRCILSNVHGYLHIGAQSCLALLTPWTIGCQTPLTMGFSKQEYWTGWSFPSLDDPPDIGIQPVSPTSPSSPALAGEFFTTEPPEKCYMFNDHHVIPPGLEGQWTVVWKPCSFARVMSLINELIFKLLQFILFISIFIPTTN